MNYIILVLIKSTAESNPRFKIIDMKNKNDR